MRMAFQENMSIDVTMILRMVMFVLSVEIPAKIWADFYDEVDNVVDLGVPVGNCRIKREITSTEPALRALTRGQAKKILEADDAPQQQGHDQTAQNIRPETMYVPCYTSIEFQRLQREDKDLEILHSWLDKNYLPSRDEVAQYSPAVRKYWLNTENIIRKRGVLLSEKVAV